MPANTVLVVIPAYNPQQELLDLVRKLSVMPEFAHLIVVDDGSGPESATVFAELRKLTQNASGKIILLRHQDNQGKGQALKTAFSYALQNFPDMPGLVTADADGQHSPEDIAQIAATLVDNPTALVLGTRTFDASTPTRSRFGNKLTSKVLHLFIGSPVSDTQTGLRGIPAILLPHLLNITANGYEFELEMLLKTVEKGLPLKEIPIQTLYFENNKSSHFRPVFDSVKIYMVFVKHVANSILSFALDYGLFALLYALSGQLLASTAIARVTSATFNFSMAKYVVFKSKNSLLKEILQYFPLALCVYGLSYLSTYLINQHTGVSAYIVKIIVDLSIYVATFAVQRLLIFRNKVHV